MKVNNKYPVLIVRQDDNEEFIHIGKGLYRTLWGIKNGSIAKTPLDAFSKGSFTFYYAPVFKK